MCGIAGEVRWDGAPQDSTRLKRMADALAHRGPDGEGSWHDAKAALAHRRLAIRDLSDAGRQPMQSVDGQLAIVFNGQIYNDQILKHELSHNYGTRFHGHCDAELLVPGFLAWGETLFEKLEGIFAIALWDGRSSTLYLTRDAAGVKPLFVHEGTGWLRFASEIKALLIGGDDVPLLDSFRLATFFALGFVGPTETLLQGIRQVAPGTVERITAEGRSARRFWHPSRNGVRQDLNEAVEEFLVLFSTVCHEQLVSDVPVGILQSGGVDSSLVALTLRDRPRPLFTAGFAKGDFDETPYAEQVARMTAHPQHWVDGGLAGDVEADFRAVVSHFDGQSADSSALAVYRLCRAVRQHVTVALSGDGADEHFAGYETYRASSLAARLSPFVPAAFAEGLGHVVLSWDRGTDDVRYPLSQKLGRLLMALPHGEVAHAHFRYYLTPSDRLRVYGPAMLDTLSESPLLGYEMAFQRGSSLLDRCLLADQTYYLPADMLRKVDAMSMAHGLEVRVPFLDRRIMRFAASLAPPLLGGNGRQLPKCLLRKALVQLGATRQLTHRPKAGFNVPVASLLRGPLRRLAEAAFVHRVDGFAPYLRPEGVRAFWQEHAEMRRNNGFALWTMLTFAVFRGLV